MWIWASVLSAVLLGLYDVAKKYALRRNGVLPVLFASTAISTLLLSPFLSAGAPEDHLRLAFKAVLVSASWISGLAALRHLPITTVSTIKGSRPVFVVLFSIVIFGERLAALQWTGVILALTAIFLAGGKGSSEVPAGDRRKGLPLMALSVATGVASALYDKHIMRSLDPLFVQSWANLYISVILGLCLLFTYIRNGSDSVKFRWDWALPVTALLITVADALYFYALKEPGALLSVVSTVRRASILVTFVAGALVFGEKNLRPKAAAMIMMAAGVALLVLS